MMTILTKIMGLIPDAIVRWLLVLAILANVLSFYKGYEYRGKLEEVNDNKAIVELQERQDQELGKLKARLEEQRIANANLEKQVREGLVEGAKEPDATSTGLSPSRVRRLNKIQ